LLLLVPLLAACATPPARAPAAAAPTVQAPPMRYAVQPPLGPRPPERTAKIAELVPQLDKLFADDLAENHYPGLGVGIVLDGEVVYARGFGLRSLEARAPFGADTVFRIASVTKGFTALAVLKLRDEGKLSLDAPAARYYPPLAALAYPTRDSPPVTLRQLLTHGSGLPEDNYWVDVSIDMTDAELVALVQSGLSFASAPDTRFAYSNLGYALIGKVIEQVTGMPAREYVRREILLPLGMTSSAWELDEVPRDRLAIGYRGEEGYRGQDHRQIQAPILRNGVFDIAGGLYTTVQDMARYLAFELSAWPPSDAAETGPVRRSTVREMQQGARRADFRDYPSVLLLPDPPPVALATDERFQLNALAYGDGLMAMTTCAQDFQVEHSGGLPGYTTFLLLLPEQGYGSILFVNDERVGSRPDREAMVLLRRAGLLVRRAVTPVPALVDARAGVDRLLTEWDAEAARRLFEPSFFSYQPVEKLAEQFARLRREHGSCRPDGALDAVNWLRGRWRLSCDSGAVVFAAALSPLAHPRLQTLVWRSELPPSPRMAEAARALAGLVGTWSEPRARLLFAPAVELARTRKALARLGVDHGRCSVERPLRGDGGNEGVFRLGCTDAPLELSLSLDEKTGRVTEWHGSPPRAADSPNCAR
ncbi:MAG TPA: serine hydrolase domain-containing protein, partial [Myxococcaceae bacterium]|nr:serine hydrolase domain-containing protein [Myxococcaceae bacterium]